ncbi:hypothetical protein [Nocardioides ultimimeridianus]
MWNRRTTSLLAATAAGLTISLTGCGAGSPGAGVAPPVNSAHAQGPGAQKHAQKQGSAAGAPAPSTALVSWAAGMCRVVAAHNQKVTPATINRSDPRATINGMSQMFGTMAGMLAAQHRELQRLPAPTSAADRAAFRHALVRLSRAEAVMRRAQGTLHRGSVAPSPDIVSTLRAAGSMTVDGKVYPGFVVDLADRERRLHAAIAAASACDAFAVA